MKCLVISSTFSPMKCGIGDYTATLAKHLTRGVELNVLTSVQASEYLKNKTIYYKLFPTIKKWNFNSFLQIAKFIKLNNFDVVNYQHSNYILKKKLLVPQIYIFLWRFVHPRIKIISTIHEYSDASLLGRVRNAVIALVSSKSIFINEQDKEKISKVLFFKKKYFYYVPVGSAIPQIKISNREVSIESDESRYILSYFGFLDKDKGIPDLFAAIKLIKNKYPKIVLKILTNVDFINNQYHIYLKELARELGISENIDWLGYQSPEKVSIALQNSRAAIFPFTKGFSSRRSSVIAAIANSTPVITTLGYKLSKAFVNDENIVLVKSSNPKEISLAVERLIIDDDFYDKIKLNSKKLKKSFDWDNIASNYLKIFKG